MSASSREAPSRKPPFAGRLGEEAADRAGDVEPRIRRATTEGVRKLSRRKAASVSPIRSLLRGMIAVCGIGQAERMAEQGGDREPVGDAADHRRLGEGADEAPGGMDVDRGRWRR